MDQAESLGSLFELRAPEVVRDVITTARQHQVPVQLLQDGIECNARITATAQKPESLDCFVPDAGLVSGKMTSLRFWLHDVAFLLEATGRQLERGHWSFACRRLFSLDRRAAERLSMAASEAQLSWRAMVDGELRGNAAAVSDLGHQGVGVVLEQGADAMPESHAFPATLQVAGREIPCLAEPRHVRRIAGRIHYGLRLRTLLGRTDCVDAYLERRFPQLVERRKLDPNQVYDLLHDSGYLALRDGVAPAREWLARRDDEAISRDVCFRDRSGHLIGHVSFTRAYGRAWLGHQLATLRPHEEAVACREAIYLHIATYPTLMDGDDAMMVGYFDRKRPWHQRFFSGFANWVSSPGLAVTFALDRFERREKGPLPPCPVPAEVEVGVARAEELVEATALVRGQLPPLIADALDIHPDSLITESLNQAYHGTRYFRGRSALSLRVGKRLVGVALCEVGSRELSIFNLFNMAQLFLATGAGAPASDAQLALLQAVRRFYAERGEPEPIIVAPPGTLHAEQEPGTFLAETMGMIAWSGRGLRQYENFIRYEFGKEREREKGLKYATVARKAV